MIKLDSNNNQSKITENPMKLYRVLVKCLSGIIKTIFIIDVKGEENIKTDGPCLVCANHLSNWDPIFMAVTVKRPVFFMAKKEIFKVPVVSTLARKLGAFPVDRENNDFTAIKTAINHLKYGNALGIFPQGTRCRGKAPETMPIKNGIGLLVFKTEADVLPVSVYTKNYKVFWFKKVYINIGEPIKFSEYGEVERSPEGYQHISDIVFSRICALTNDSKEAATNE